MPRTIICSGGILRARSDASIRSRTVRRMPVDFAAEGLLDRLEGEQRAARERLLRRLHDDGVPLEDLRAAVEEQRLLLLPAERLIGGEPRFTMREVADKTGLTIDFLQALRRANGIPVPEPDTVAFT